MNATFEITNPNPKSEMAVRTGEERPVVRELRVGHLVSFVLLVVREPGRDLSLVIDELLARDVDDDLVDGAAGEPVRRGVLGRDR